MSNKQTAAILDKKLDEKTAHYGLADALNFLYTKRRGDDRCP